MFDPFVVIDGLKWRGNILRDDAYLRKVFTIFSLLMVPVWFILGFDSGIGLLERAIVNLPSLLNGSIGFGEWVADAYVLYGRTFHFSAFVTYGLLYVGLSDHLDLLGIVRSRNVFFSVFLVALNVACFELVWMGCFAKFQMNRGIYSWLVSDWWFLGQWFAILGLGLFGLVAVWSESFFFVKDKFVKRIFRLNLRLKDFIIPILTVGLWIMWIYYPFHVEQISFDGWTSSLLFPQTHYAYKSGILYLENNLLHGLNILVKFLFAGSQLCLLRRFRSV